MRYSTLPVIVTPFLDPASNLIQKKDSLGTGGWALLSWRKNGDQIAPEAGISSGAASEGDFHMGKIFGLRQWSRSVIPCAYQDANDFVEELEIGSLENTFSKHYYIVAKLFLWSLLPK